MKKIVLLLFVFTISGQSYAQKFRFGLTATPLMINWLKSNTDGITSGGVKLGFTYGLAAEYNLTDRYAIASGIHVMYRGGKLEQSYTDTTGAGVLVKNNVTAQYLELPITLKMKTKAIGSFVYFGQFGFGLGYNIKGKSVLDIGNVEVTDKDYNTELIGPHVALHIGLGTNYEISESTDIVGTLYWNNGFTDIFKEKGVKAVTNNIGLSIGILF